MHRATCTEQLLRSTCTEHLRTATYTEQFAHHTCAVIFYRATGTERLHTATYKEQLRKRLAQSKHSPSNSCSTPAKHVCGTCTETLPTKERQAQTLNKSQCDLGLKSSQRLLFSLDALCARPKKCCRAIRLLVYIFPSHFVGTLFGVVHIFVGTLFGVVHIFVGTLFVVVHGNQRKRPKRLGLCPI